MKDITEAKDAIGSEAHKLNSLNNYPLTKTAISILSLYTLQ